MSGLSDGEALNDPPRRPHQPQRLFRPPDPIPTTAQVIERDPVLAALRATGIVSDADLEWLAQTGRAYTGGKLPWFIQREPEGAGQCYSVAERLAEEWGYSYVVGFGLPPEIPTPMPHAWCGDGRSAIDPTWKDQTACHYFGIAGRNHRNMRRLHDMSLALHIEYGIEEARKVLWPGVAV